MISLKGGMRYTLFSSRAQDATTFELIKASNKCNMKQKLKTDIKVLERWKFTPRVLAVLNPKTLLFLSLSLSLSLFLSLSLSLYVLEKCQGLS